MSGSYVRMEIDHAALTRLDKAALRALVRTARQVKTDVKQAQVIPRDVGALSGTGFFVDESHALEGHVELVNSTPYARRLYYHPEYNFHQEEWVDRRGKHHIGNPNAKGKWFEDWEAGGARADFITDTFGKLYKREARV